ncbi:MAG: hypothetical protein JWQ90_1142 [Hydrocarboniphaga sp.]|uniref:DUF3237 domain-containing protein n=1 Tax=Hydrocarboniphaga sp. TaxID=2033016 RepID=UPI002603AFD3|nr:DUF3237 domain-containing protein [Hydrocarboniphaga sp.]MDB5968692.1 hypothetical protein [Hydrocarboniphaga sp.]
MSDDIHVDAAIELLLILSARTHLVSTLVGTPLGDRSVFDVDGGHFEGPQLRGRVPASGGDWVTRTAAGSQQDVRLLLETDDGITILLRYQGKASQRADGLIRIEVAGSFEAPQGRYAWLNSLQAFGLGTPTQDGVRYQFYRFTRDR